MEIQDLYVELNKIGLRVVWDIEQKRASVGNPDFANPLLWFDAFTTDYQGNVQVKSINVPLFSEYQIKKTLLLVDNFLQTPLENRSLNSIFPRRN